MVTIKGIELKTSLDEFTISEFEQIMSILNDNKLNNIDKYLEVLVVAGMKDESILVDVSFSELKEYMESIQITTGEYKLINEFELNNRKYIAFKDELIFTAKDVAMIENSIKKNGIKYILDVMAILFKDDQLTFREHYDESHIKHKKALFNELPASYVYPYLPIISSKLVTKIKNLEHQEKIDNIIENYENFNAIQNTNSDSVE